MSPPWGGPAYLKTGSAYDVQHQFAGTCLLLLLPLLAYVSATCLASLESEVEQSHMPVLLRQ